MNWLTYNLIILWGKIIHLFGRHTYRKTWWYPNVPEYANKIVITYTCEFCDYKYDFTGKKYNEWLTIK